MNKTALTLSIVLLASSITACADTGTKHQAHVFDSRDVNRRQEAKLINIISLEAAKVRVDNSRNQNRAGIGGAAIGAVLGAGIAHASKNREAAAAGGAVLGGIVGSELAGGDALVDGVNILYMENGQLLNSVQVGKMCEFAQGAALVLVSRRNETRIQPNAATPCVKGKEQIVGTVSKYQNDPTAATLQTAPQGHTDKLSDMQREKELTRSTIQLKRGETELLKEQRRTETAKERADSELR